MQKYYKTLLEDEEEEESDFAPKVGSSSPETVKV